jgi:ABC-type uncharacterized transport system substrate-binding protein
MRRRNFITLLGGAAAAWPVTARAQQDGRTRRIATLINGIEGDERSKFYWAAFRDGLAKLGWVEGRNLRIDVRYGEGEVDRDRRYAAELVSLAPEVIVTTATVTTIAVQQLTKTIPIVFAGGGDPVVTGVVRNLARPEGNTTGFSPFEPSIAGKWLQLLKDAAPHLTRVAVLVNPELLIRASGVGPAYIGQIEAAARALALKTIELPFRDAIGIVRAIDAFATEPNGGLLVLPPPPGGANRQTIIRLAEQHRLPTIYPDANDPRFGGLISYASNAADRYRGAASYVDRLLRGAKVSDLPVQFPTKFELIINLKTAKAIGLTIPEAFLLRADELIE